ncbi:MAG: DUF4293 domain-containing protein [Prevotella sp.]|nr:DUF4293 domain-containing protein [Prevotella sp.]
MIQRKQTLFLLIAFVLTIVCSCCQIGSLVSDMSVVSLYNLWLVDEMGQHSFSTWPLLAVLILASLLSLVTIFLYHKRKLQARLCLLHMLLLVLWYVVLAVLPQSLGGSLVLEWPAVLPAVAIILSFMARKGVLADEKLVRSLDRIR